MDDAGFVELTFTISKADIRKIFECEDAELAEREIGKMIRKQILELAFRSIVEQSTEVGELI